MFVTDFWVQASVRNKNRSKVMWNILFSYKRFEMPFMANNVRSFWKFGNHWCLHTVFWFVESQNIAVWPMNMLVVRSLYYMSHVRWAPGCRRVLVAFRLFPFHFIAWLRECYSKFHHSRFLSFPFSSRGANGLGKDPASWCCLTGCFLLDLISCSPVFVLADAPQTLVLCCCWESWLSGSICRCEGL